MPFSGVYSAQIAATIHPTEATRQTENPHHSMKNTAYNLLLFVLPAAIFGVIIHDGLTLSTAHHSGTQHAIYTTTK